MTRTVVKFFRGKNLHIFLIQNKKFYQIMLINFFLDAKLYLQFMSK